MAGSAALGWATSALAQNGQDPATSGGSNTTTLPQEAQVTSSACAVRGCSFEAPAADIYSSKEWGITSTAPAEAGSAWVCPQKGHFMPPVAGSNNISAEQPGQGNWTAILSGIGPFCLESGFLSGIGQG